jgi:hypothetical protein
VTGWNLAGREVPSDILHPRANLCDFVVLDIAANFEVGVIILQVTVLDLDECDRATGNACSANWIHREEDINKDALGYELYPLNWELDFLILYLVGRCQLWRS